MEEKRVKRTVAMVLLALLLVASTAVVVAQAAPPSDAGFIGDADGDRLSDDLGARLGNAGPSDGIPVIVVMSQAADDVALAQLDKVAGGFKLTARWDRALNGFAATLNKGQIQALARHDLVSRIDYDRPVYACLGTATQWTGVQQIWTAWGVNGDRDGVLTTYSATDVVICVLDTGIDAVHVDLDGGKVIGWYDTILGQTTPYDDNGHGTHCSSIAAGSGDGNAAYKGVAPGAALVGVKVLNSQGSGTTTGIINGINWMITNKTTYGIRIGSMSLGSTGSSDGTDSLSLAVNSAVTNGIVMVVAAGNSGPNAYTVGSPGAATGAITVGALYDPGEKGWVLAEFSSRGPTKDNRIKPDISAPGRYITAAKANSSNQYVIYSGTSMATPFIAGVVALMLDANYTLTDTGVKGILYASGNVKDFGPVGMDSEFGYGICLPYNCVKQAGAYTTTWTDGLSSSYTAGSLHAKSDFDNYSIVVTDATKPIGVTCVIPNASSTKKNFDIYLYNPSGTLVASSVTYARQEQILYLPTVTGTYTFRVLSRAGTGDYWFSASWK
jgi:serine protease AprX